MRTPFFGPAYISRSTNLADCQCINLFPEVCETKQGKDIGLLALTPGLTLLATVGTGPIRGLHAGSQKLEGQLFAASGSHLFVLDTAFNSRDLGQIGQPLAGPAAMIDNGFQLAVASGNQLFAYTSGGIAPVQLPFSSQPISLSYQDGFGVANQAGSALWWQSDLNNLTNWDALNFASADTDPDAVVAIMQVRREMYLIKQQETEIWYNVGTPHFAFARNQGVLIEHGTCAPASVAKSDESLLWLEQNSEGLGIVIEVTGFAARKVSTHGLEFHWSTFPTMTDAIGYAVQVAGHSWYVLTFPSGDETWVYDRTESGLLGAPMWHRWSCTDSDGVWHRHWGNAFAFFNGQPVVGDFSNGNIYLLDPSSLLDWRQPRSWLRSWRATPQPNDQPVRHNLLRIDMETGFPSQAAADPLLSLTWSDDGGHTWANGMVAKAGAQGETARRVIFRRLGTTRRDSGLDRIYQVYGEASFQTRIIGAELL